MRFVHPVLYYYRLKEYSKRDVVEKAWTEVGKEISLTNFSDSMSSSMVDNNYWVQYFLLCN